MDFQTNELNEKLRDCRQLILERPTKEEQIELFS